MDENKIKKDVTRRSFIKGAAIGAGAIAMTGISSITDSSAAPPPKKWDMSADIVVVGAGAAGLSAAVSGLESGASVIVIEREPVQGGSSAISTGSILCTGNELQKQAGIEDSPEALFKHLRSFNENLNDEKLVRVLVNNIGTYI